MLRHISISNFATIEHTEFDLHDGLNIITGETGAGKSVVVDAISLALGARADTSLIRTGTDRASVQLLADYEGRDIVISRELSSTGRNLCKLNGELTTLTNLNELSSKLADIHGQYDNQSLLNPDNHFALVDSYRKELVEPLKASVTSLYQSYMSKRQELISLLTLQKENSRKKDFYTFEISEIDKFHLKAGEDQELEERIAILQNSEKIFAHVSSALTLLSESSPSVEDGLSHAARAMEALSDFGADFRRYAEELNDAYYRVQDIAECLRDKQGDMVFSPNELDTAISRQSSIDDLKHKYGESIEEILQYRDRISHELAQIENFDDEKQRLEKELISKKRKLISESAELTKVRKMISEELQDRITDELRQLNFQNAIVKIDISPLEQPSSNGMDKLEILISTNLGEALKPLYKVASGGEMSRIMLAFKNIISSYDKIPTLIFDEIDSGISGITASIVGKKLLEISQEHQVICITHLPQIAARGKYNFRISKQSDDTKTYTTVEMLDEVGKIDEIARLLGGADITDTTINSARELIGKSDY